MENTKRTFREAVAGSVIAYIISVPVLFMGIMMMFLGGLGNNSNFGYFGVVVIVFLFFPLIILPGINLYRVSGKWLPVFIHFLPLTVLVGLYICLFVLPQFFG